MLKLEEPPALGKAGEEWPSHERWLTENRPDLVKVRAPGIRGSVVTTGLVGLIALLFISLGAAQTRGWWAWLLVLGVLLAAGAFVALVAALREDIVATPDSLEVTRRLLMSTPRVKFEGRPEEIGLPENVLLRVGDPCLVAEFQGREVRFGRALTPEARAWLLLRLKVLWGLAEEPIDPPRDPR